MWLPSKVSIFLAAVFILIACTVYLTVSIFKSADANLFTVAEVKPHFGCRSRDGQDRVRGHIAGLTRSSTGIIAMMQTEFTVNQPPGYTVFGASCVCKYPDPVVVLVDESQFTILSAIGTTSVGNYAEMPFVYDGKAPAKGSMCAANCSAPGVGERAYAGAVLQHKSGEEICVIAGTFPHSKPKLGHFVPMSQQFLRHVEGCHQRKILLVFDTNVRPDSQTVAEIGDTNHVTWGPCSDPGAYGDATCCNDTRKAQHPDPQFRFDRTVLCGGGSVTDWTVESSYFCNADEEHRFTKATVRLFDHFERLVV